MSIEKFVKPLYPPTMSVDNFMGSTIDLTKVMIGKTPTYIGNPRKEDGSDFCQSPLIVFINGERLSVRGRQALQFIDPKFPEAAGRLLVDLLREHLSTWTWSEEDWHAVRTDVTNYFGLIPVADTPQQMTKDEERLLAHSGASEQILQICRTNWVRPMPTPKAYLEMQAGSEADVIVGKWDEQSHLIAIAVSLRAADVDLATKLGFKLAWKRPTAKVA